ncbi:MAG: acetylglutamate kinase [Ferruginibacter sp.]
MQHKKQLFIIKIGGNVIDHEPVLNAFLKNFAEVDALRILVHGGGKIATRMGERLGLLPNYINGRRITDAATLEVVSMVYGGLVNKNIVTSLQEAGCNAIGLTGADANIIPAQKRPVSTIDYGFVGDVITASINTKALQLFLENGMVPVIAPITHDAHAQLLNTNADTIAASLAVALSTEYDVRLIYCFEKKGVLENVDDEQSVIRFIDRSVYQDLKNSDKIFEGMIPKIDNAFAAIDEGVKAVLIGHSDDLKQNISNETVGTLIQ